MFSQVGTLVFVALLLSSRAVNALPNTYLTGRGDSPSFRYVTSPDYEGPNAAFTAELKASQATLDAIRATLKSNKITNISSDAKTVMWGYSGGSIPTQFAAQLQLHYAPDLSDSLLGATAGGIIANLSATLQTMTNTRFARLGLGGLKGFSQEYPEVAKYVKEHLVSDKADSFHEVGTLCLEPLEDKFKNASIFGFLDNDEAMLSDPELAPIFNKNIMGQETPKVPLFMYHSIKDEISPIKQIDDLVKAYCDAGGRTMNYKDLESEHAVLFVTGAPDAINWIKDRFDGKPVADGCSTKELTTSLESAGAVEMLGIVVLDNFKKFFASKISEAASMLDTVEDNVDDWW